MPDALAKTMRNTMRRARLSLGIVALAASCGFPRLPELADGGIGADDGAAPSNGGPRLSGLELLAGDIRGLDYADGTGAAARFGFPCCVAVDSAGNVYVADTDNAIIRKITPAGLVTTLAGTPGMRGSADGPGAAASFDLPTGIAVDSAGNVYVAEVDNATVRKISPGGIVTTLAGTAGMGGSADGTGGAARFFIPSGLAVDGSGNVYVADQFNHTIRKITATGVVTTLAGQARSSGSADGTGSAARFNYPQSVAVDGAGNVYVADKNNHTIRKITPAGVVTTITGAAGISGSADGAGAAARFSFPAGVAVDGGGNLYVADSNNSTLRRVTPAGVVTTLAGTASTPGSADGVGPTARFYLPLGVTVDSAGSVYVADWYNQTIRKITSDRVVTTLAGSPGLYGSADSSGAAVRFSFPPGVTVDSAGNVYVADVFNDVIRKVTATGVVTLAGTAGMAGNVDGVGSAARFDSPSGVAVDRAGNLYVADARNSTIRKVTAAGVVTTLAGTAGLAGGADGTGAAARFDFPSGVAIDSTGNLYVADTGNSTIRKVTPAGVVTTLAGTARLLGSRDATGFAATFVFPFGIAVDGTGNVYVADTGNSTIRKITPDGVVTTLSGTASMAGDLDGPSAAARFRSPSGVTVDPAGDLYIADTGNSAIRKVTPTGRATTIAGMPGMPGIVLGATPRFQYPRSVAIDGDSLVIGDSNAVLLLHRGVQ